MSCRNTRSPFCLISDFRSGLNEVLQIAVYEELVKGTVTALNPVSYVYRYLHTDVTHRCVKLQNDVIHVTLSNKCYINISNYQLLHYYKYFNISRYSMILYIITYELPSHLLSHLVLLASFHPWAWPMIVPDLTPLDYF
jgi:hypothetical protein